MNASPGVPGASGPALSAPQYSPLPTQGVAPQDSVQGAGKQSCLQTSVLCLPPGCARRALGRKARSAPPGTNAKGTGVAASPVFTYPATPEPRPGQGLLGIAGPSRPPSTSSLPGDPRKKGRGPRAAGRPQCQDAPSARPDSWRQGP